MNLLTRLFALHFDRSFSGKGWRQLAWLFGVIVTVFLLIYLISFAFNAHCRTCNMERKLKITDNEKYTL